jgi:hypothetical protein
MVLEPTTTPGPWVWSAGAWVSWAQEPVVLRDPSSGAIVARPLGHALGLDVTAGLGLGPRLGVGVDVPLFLWQDGSTGLPASTLSSGTVPSVGMGDVAILAKATIVDDETRGAASGFGLAALASATVPTGDRTSFAGDGAVRVGMRVLAEYAMRRVGAARASLGYTLRTAEQTWPDASVGGVAFGDEIPWSVGVVLKPKGLSPFLDPGSMQLWEVALHGSLPAGPVAPFGLGGRGATALSPALLAVDDRVALGHLGDAYLLAGAELGLDAAVGVPTFRAVVSFGWAAWLHDRDHDGILDESDQCPDLPEDRDGVEDRDGCPEDDADGDGVVDTEDACPTMPGGGGAQNGNLETHGCPGPRGPAPRLP